MSSLSDQDLNKSPLLHKLEKVLELICYKDYKSKSCKDSIYTLLDNQLIWKYLKTIFNDNWSFQVLGEAKNYLLGNFQFLVFIGTDIDIDKPFSQTYVEWFHKLVWTKSISPID